MTEPDMTILSIGTRKDILPSLASVTFPIGRQTDSPILTASSQCEPTVAASLLYHR